MSTRPPAFTGFGEHAIDFFDGMLADNSRAYWLDHQDRYTDDVRTPMVDLLAELSAEFGDFGAAKVFRPCRDVRFTRDRSPYKTHCGGVIEQARGAGAFYVEISPAGLRIGGGCYHLATDQLRRYRAAVAHERRGGQLAGLVAALARGGWQVCGDRLKTAPRGVSVDHPRIDLLRRRALYVQRLFPPDDALHDRRTLRRVRSGWRQVRALNEWVADHVGPPAGPDGH